MPSCCQARHFFRPGVCVCVCFHFNCEISVCFFSVADRISFGNLNQIWTLYNAKHTPNALWYGHFQIGGHCWVLWMGDTHKKGDACILQSIHWKNCSQWTWIITSNYTFFPARLTFIFDHHRTIFFVAYTFDSVTHQ